jgi:hypothetical protein
MHLQLFQNRLLTFKKAQRQMNIRLDFLFGLNEPHYSRIEFWESKQKDSKFSPLVYWKKLNDAWKFYYDKIDTAINENKNRGVVLDNLKLPLFIETNGLLLGHYGKDELSHLQSSLFEYGKKLKQNLFPYAYDLKILISESSPPSKQFELWHSVDKQRFQTDLKKILSEQIGEFLSFHLRYYERLIKDETNFNELRSTWINNTLSLLPFDFSLKQRDSFLSWFEQIQTFKQTEAITKQATPKKLSDLITHKNCVEIVESIKIQYKNIKGKRLKLLLLAFQDLKLLPQERIAHKFYDCCKIEFKWDISSYNAMNGYKFNSIADSDEFANMKEYLETLIKTN